MDKLRRVGLLSFTTLLLSLQLAAQQKPPRPPASDFNIELIKLEAPSFIASVPGARARSGLVGEEIDTETVNELTERFSKASEDIRKRRIREELKNSLRSVKHNLRREIEKFEHQLNHSAGNGEFGVWVKETLQELEGMLGSKT